MKIKIKFLGRTSSGKFSKYAVVETAAKLPATITALEADGVEMNKNLGVPGFISQTHLFSTPNVGDEVEIEVKGFAQGVNTVNFFPLIDKVKQKAFAEKAKLEAEFSEVRAYATGLESFNLSFDDVANMQKIKNLKAQGSLIAKQLSAFGE